jgi:hypothetical protein
MLTKVDNILLFKVSIISKLKIKGTEIEHFTNN